MNSKTLVFVVFFALCATLLAQTGSENFNTKNATLSQRLRANFRLIRDKILNKLRQNRTFRVNETVRRTNKGWVKSRADLNLIEAQGQNKTCRFAQKIKSFLSNCKCNKTKAAVKALVQQAKDLKIQIVNTINNKTIHNELRANLENIKQAIRQTVRNARNTIQLQEETRNNIRRRVVVKRGGSGNGGSKNGGSKNGGRKGEGSFNVGNVRFGRVSQKKSVQLQEETRNNVKRRVVVKRGGSGNGGSKNGGSKNGGRKGEGSFNVGNVRFGRVSQKKSVQLQEATNTKRRVVVKRGGSGNGGSKNGGISSRKRPTPEEESSSREVEPAARMAAASPASQLRAESVAREEVERRASSTASELDSEEARRELKLPLSN
eukprot:TRINITY_DN1147_c0_g1_i12.p1 TRINITY_DN1147_c0_g1~~TRINITY_DN1147_c0_g1_i12.p1  ORF type:complete len:376 (+),score=117.29 TRINITY_DN1147_c0_g1_i12:137-1264(+)